MFCYFNSFFFTLINSVLDKFTIKYIIKVYFTTLAAGYVKRSKYRQHYIMEVKDIIPKLYILWEKELIEAHRAAWLCGPMCSLYTVQSIV